MRFLKRLRTSQVLLYPGSIHEKLLSALLQLDKLQSRKRRCCLIEVGTYRESNQPILKSKNDETSKTTARLTQRGIFQTSKSEEGWSDLAMQAEILF